MDCLNLSNPLTWFLTDRAPRTGTFNHAEESAWPTQ
jgi:hypothetical protein